MLLIPCIHYDVQIIVGLDTQRMLGNGSAPNTVDQTVAGFRSACDIDDYNYFETAGMYNGEPESSVNIAVNYLTAAQVRALEKSLEKLATCLNQESIAVSVRRSTSKLVFSSKSAA